MKAIILIISIASIILMQNIYAQVPNIKNEISELFHTTPFCLSKFDLRKKIHGNVNFSNLDEIDMEDGETYFSVDFKLNSKMSYLSPTGEKKFIFIFNDKANAISLSLISMKYKTTEINTCVNQYEEFLSLFKKISAKYESKKIVTLSSDDVIGEGLDFYSSSINWTQKKAYLSVDYYYSELDKCYTLDLQFFKLNL